MGYLILRHINNSELLFLVFYESNELNIIQLFILSNLLLSCSQFVTLLITSKQHPHCNFREKVKNNQVMVAPDPLPENVSPATDHVTKEKLIEKIAIYKRFKNMGMKNVDPKEYQRRLDESSKNPITKEDWMKLREVIDDAYNNFTGRILSDFPKLSECDIQLCYLLMIKLDDTEITHVLAISSGAVRARKSRFKKKLNFEKAPKEMGLFLRNF